MTIFKDGFCMTDGPKPKDAPRKMKHPDTGEVHDESEACESSGCTPVESALERWTTHTEREDFERLSVNRDFFMPTIERLCRLLDDSIRREKKLREGR